MKKVEIEVPDGYELVKTDEGWKLVKEDKNVILKQVSYGTSNDIICITEAGTTVAFIGWSFAPKGLESKCLVLNDTFDWEFVAREGFHICIPTKKQ